MFVDSLESERHCEAVEDDREKIHRKTIEANCFTIRGLNCLKGINIVA
jgi:hypothetical protein